MATIDLITPASPAGTYGVGSTVNFYVRFDAPVAVALNSG